jgi:hypothetical protein
MSCLPTQKKRTVVSVISGDDTVNFSYRIDALATQADNILQCSASKENNSNVHLNLVLDTYYLHFCF